MKKGKNPNVWPAIVMLLLMMVSTAIGRTIYVDDDGTAEFDNIQAAIDDSNSGDTIIVRDGTYRGDGNRDIDFLGKAIMVRSENGPENCIIDCQGSKSDKHRGFYFHSNEDANSIVDGFTITNGWGPIETIDTLDQSAGGGIHCNQSGPKIKNCIIRDNMASIEATHIVGAGAGIYCKDANTVITDCLIENNGALPGLMGPKPAETAVGGGIVLLGGSPTISGCIIIGNEAGMGGGIACAESQVTLLNCNINGNSALIGAGALLSGNIVVSNCTISDNKRHPDCATCDGGGILWPGSGNLMVSNCIVWGNDGNEIHGIGVNVTYSAIEGSYTGTGNIDADPCFADPCTGDYHLKSQAGRWDPNSESWVYDDVTSPCIDGGNPGCPLGDEPNDPNNIRINMGAYGGTAEASKTPANWRNIADLTNDRVVDFNDLKVFVDYWLDTGECIPSDLNRSQSVDFSDFAIFAKNWLKGELPMDELVKPGLARYYVPYDNPAEPSAPGYSLPLNLGAVGNYADMDSKFGLSSVAPLLEQNGFAVMEYDFHVPDSNRDDIVKPYTYLRDMDVPLFVTADTLLHLYHVQFDETLKDVEEREFVSDINELTAALLDGALAQYGQYTGELQEAARRNVAYLAVAQKLSDPNVSVPAFVADTVASELAKIDAHAGFAPSDIFIYAEDYSQYVPRGHYTRSEELKRYFRTLMWYGRMAFLLKGAESWGPMGDALISVYDAKVQTMQAVLLATSLEAVQVGERSGRDVWDRLYAVTSFYVGLADDLTPYEYLGVLNKVFGSSFAATDLLDEDNFFALKVELALLRSPEIFGGTGNVFVTPPITPESLDEVLDKTKGMRFMGQRFIPDSYMFQHLVFPEVLDYTGDTNPKPFTYGFTGIRWARCYPCGLDVMAILGSDRARTILIEQGDTDYIDYWPRFNELKAEFDAFDVSDWNRNLYWGWLYSLRALIEGFGEGYPNFMRTQAWEKKELNAALASWTELRHDTILYAKQSYTPGEIGIPPFVSGYVEPVPEFYGRLLALTRMTRQGLSNLDALSAQAAERLVNLEEILTRLIEIANKELMNQALSDDDYEYIMGFGKTLEGAIIGVEEKGVKTTLVADVHTHGIEQLVVEEGVGYVDLIIVACPIPDGSIVLSAGPALSYYEFKHPMSDRLTDEAWCELLDSAQRPDRPRWFQPLVH